MDKLPVTAIIHTRNAEEYLEEVIDSLAGYDEVLIVDMDSTDSTLEIARRKGCNILKVEPMGYADPARDFAMRKAGHDWVFFVDADELIPDELTQWLRNFIQSPGNVKAVAVPRKNMMMDFWNRASYPDYQLRILDRRSCTWPAFVHSRPVVDGETMFLPRARKELAMIHKPPRIAEMMERLNRYTTLEMERKQDMKVSWFKLWMRPKVRFFKAFILKGGFRDGMRGYIAAKHDAAYQHFYLTKILEYQLDNAKK